LDTIRIATAIRKLNHPRPRLRSRRLAAPLLAGAAAALLLGTVLAGPVHAATGWAATGSLPNLGSGRIWQVAYAAANPNLAAAATDNGVYLSSDGGNTWSATGLHGSRVWTVTFAATAGQGETLYAGLATGGVRASTDSGMTWANDSSGLPSLDVREIAVTGGGLAAGTDNGVALSTNGTTWYAGGLTGESISALAGVSTVSGLVLFAGVDYPGNSKAYLYKLNSSVGGWQTISAGLPSGDVVDSISIGPTSQVVTSNPILVTTVKGTYRSANGGTNWTTSTGLPTDTYLTDATFSPLDPNLVYAGADAGGSSGGGLFRSTDGGQSFSGASQGLPTSHAPNEPPRQEVESISVAAGQPYPTVIAAIDPYQEDASIYREVDTGAPSPPVLTTLSGIAATLPPSVASTPPAGAAGSTPSGTHTPSPAATVASSVAGTVFHFPSPLVFELAFVLLAIVLLIRWRRHYYVDGPP